MAESYLLTAFVRRVRPSLPFRRYLREVHSCGGIRRWSPLPDPPAPRQPLLLCRGASVCALTNCHRLAPSWSTLAVKVQRLSVKIQSAQLHSKASQLERREYEKLADATMDELSEFFEDIGDSGLCHSDFEATFADGVLTVHLGGDGGTYVINKQAPNKQIWLSSPISGPKRYDVIDGRWRYSHDHVALHDLLSQEFTEIFRTEIDLSVLEHSSISTSGESWT